MLPTAPVSIPPRQPKPTELEILLKRPLSGVPAPLPHTGITGMEALLQPLLLGAPVIASRARPGPAHRDWTTIVCISCVKSGHSVCRCPEMNETFPYMLLGWSAEKVGGNYMMISPRIAVERLRAGNCD